MPGVQNTLQATFDPLPIFAAAKTAIASNAPEPGRSPKREKNSKTERSILMNAYVGRITLIVTLFVSLIPKADACTRFLYETGTETYIVSRSMDWAEDPGSDLWAFPRGMARDGGAGPESIKWNSKYGSIATAFYNIGTCDGMNEAGLVANALYLAEADYGNANASGRPLLSIGAWVQYALDNYATVAEAVDGLRKEPFAIVAPDLPNGRKAGAHLALSDASGDNAIFEYIDGQLVIHHDRSYTVMCNSPAFEDQLAINTYWNEVGGVKFLPGTHRSSDRFARMSWNLNAAPKESDSRMAAATALSLIRTISVPLGLADPEKPNIAATIWRTMADIHARRYYFESSFNPAIFWADIDKLNLEPGSKPSKLDLSSRPTYAGEVSDKFIPAEPFKFLYH